MVFPCLEKNGVDFMLPSGKRPGASAWRGEVGGSPHLSSVISFHQPCLCTSCTLPLIRPRVPHVPLPAHHPTLNEGLLFLRSSHFPHRGDPTACPWSPCIPSHPLLFAAHFSQAARGVLRKLIWMLTPTCLKSLHGCFFHCKATIPPPSLHPHSAVSPLSTA